MRLVVSSVRTGHRGGESVPLANDGFEKPWLLGVIAQNDSDFAHRGINAVVHVEEDIFSPKALRNLFARDQFATTSDEQEEQLHRQLFQTEYTHTALQPIARLIEREVSELELAARSGLLGLIGWVAGIMRQDGRIGKTINDLASYESFISS